MANERQRFFDRTQLRIYVSGQWVHARTLRSWVSDGVVHLSRGVDAKFLDKTRTETSEAMLDIAHDLLKLRYMGREACLRSGLNEFTTLDLLARVNVFRDMLVEVARRLSVQGLKIFEVALIRDSVDHSRSRIRQNLLHGEVSFVVLVRGFHDPDRASLRRCRTYVLLTHANRRQRTKMQACLRRRLRRYVRRVGYRKQGLCVRRRCQMRQFETTARRATTTVASKIHTGEGIVQPGQSTCPTLEALSKFRQWRHYLFFCAWWMKSINCCLLAFCGEAGKPMPTARSVKSDNDIVIKLAVL